jgi:hypothetical protein
MNEVDEKNESSGALLVLVARKERSQAQIKLTSFWTPEQWDSLAEETTKSKMPIVLMPEKRIALIPDLEIYETLEFIEVHQVVRIIFKERKVHADGCAIVFFSSFTKDSQADFMIKRSFDILLTVHSMHGKSLLVYDEANEYHPALE